MKHVVQPGETLTSIAHLHGFATHRALLDHPENAALKAKRPNPNLLNPGDEVFIPELEPKALEIATEQRHKFTASREELVLRVKVLDLNRDQLHLNCFYDDEFQVTVMPEINGAYETKIDSRARTAKMRLTAENPEEAPVIVKLDLGALNTLDDPQGQQDRLNNLGYFAGFSRTSLATAQFSWAVEEFQCDHKLAVDGVIGPATKKELEKRHGV